ncbi:CHAT domain-containing protein [Streptomyces rapamycinicus]|uniref:CHAT domain-containing protein n=2 Tax=Streptomyces rapamycinicus TaxID=1226757 RepID=A0A3L8QZH1_STRRN|nr:CHAT domain-containing protein [Streptomyces rapamycinicus]MBB4788342.1 hypothetical protein [Streptomyces rapamycinicus]RLV72677.1 CHAT domain-containing protein [Streptomyces rapamycinicus NRRL 5491]UTP36057.1 CHAT domain-containing protein [Streptomyces rapamycinicus NRRL 5491]
MHGRDLAALRDRAERAAADALAWIAPPPPEHPAAGTGSKDPGSQDPRSQDPGSQDPGPDGPSDGPAATRAPDGTRPPLTADSTLLDRHITELDGLEAELAAAVADGDALLCTVRARLGGLYAERYGRDPTDGDRSRGLRVLRAARAPAVLGPRDERASAFHLVRLLLTPAMTAGWDGTLSRLLESFDIGRRVALGDPELTADLTELRGLVADLAPTLPEEAAESLFWAADILERVPAVVRSRDLGQMADLAEQTAQRLPGRGSDLVRGYGTTEGGRGKAEDGRGERDAPVRLVLVPCGNLGAVPWHAARLPGPRDGVRRRYAYACEDAVISYAASGGEFLRAARRGRVPANERAVLVADPSGDLTWAQDEVTALRTAYYTEALLYGWHEDAPGHALGTPDDVLFHLPGGPAAPAASLLHLVAHGLAGLRPTDSALHLAGPDTADAPDPADTPAPGRLTVTRILDVPAGERAATGPLIVLSACETDLSSRDHDEALTPTTALLARGATDVVGSRWKVSDSASAALMVVFHHRLTVVGLAPPDALRAAQLWMLDHDRHPVPGLTGLLLAETQRDAGGLARTVSWAGFIHQGNPAPHAPVEGRQA